MEARASWLKRALINYHLQSYNKYIYAFILDSEQTLILVDVLDMLN